VAIPPVNAIDHSVRGRLVEALRRRFVCAGTKRMEIQLILVLTGAVGFGASFAMLRLGVEEMWLRYPLAALCGWFAFLAMVRLWAEAERNRFASDAAIDELAASAGSGAGKPERNRDSGGGDGSWDWLEWFNPFEYVDDLGGFALALLLCVVLVALAGLIVAIIGLIGGAEVLLAEVVLDAVLVSALYRRLQHLEARWWLASAARQTFVPVLVAIVFLACAGLLFQQIAPDAHSIRGVWRDVRQPESLR
jgi:hypothetical protein